MATMHRIAETRSLARQTFFDRNELNQLLSLYSRRVASGEWRDYAIDQKGGCAVFSVFRHSQDAPLFRIAKRIGGSGAGHGEYIVWRGRQTLSQAASLREALSPVFGRHLTLVR